MMLAFSHFSIYGTRPIKEKGLHLLDLQPRIFIIEMQLKPVGHIGGRI